MENLGYEDLKLKLLELAEQMGLLRDRKQLPGGQFQLPEGDLDLVCFQIEEQHYALYLPAVTEAIRMVKLTPLPNVPPAIVGLLNLRRQIVPVIDLRILLGFPAKPYDENTPIILVEFEGKKRSVVVDAISEVIKAPADAVEKPTGVIPHSKYILAMIREQSGLIMVLDHTKLLEFENEQLNLLSLTA